MDQGVRDGIVSKKKLTKGIIFSQSVSKKGGTFRERFYKYMTARKAQDAQKKTRDENSPRAATTGARRLRYVLNHNGERTSI